MSQVWFGLLVISISLLVGALTYWLIGLGINNERDPEDRNDNTPMH